MAVVLSRRCFLRSVKSLAIASASSLPIFSRKSHANEFSADPVTVEKWMDGWMNGDKKPIGNLFVSRFADPIYFLTKPITWTPNPGQEAYRPVTVPVGFVTDFASIPRLFWSLLRPDGNYTYPAVVHDFLYWNQDRSKEEADQILKFGMEDFSIDAVSLTAIYDGVHLFGRSAWDENTRLKGNGEHRTLKVFPDNPTTTWAEWKMRPEVFGSP